MYSLAAAMEVQIVYLLATGKKVKIVYLLAAARKVNRVCLLAAGRKVALQIRPNSDSMKHKGLELNCITDLLEKIPALFVTTLRG